MGEQGVRVHKTFCRICIASCGIEVSVGDDGRIAKVSADRDHPMSQGYMCVKGRQLASQVESADRLTGAQRRSAFGGFEDVATETALDEIATRLGAIVDRHGPDAVASFCGTALYANAAGVAIVRAWHEAIGSRMNFTTLTIDQPSKILAVERIGVWAGGGQAFSTADVAMLVGNNPVVSGLQTPGGPPGYNPVQAIQDARRRGLKLIVVDPRRSEVAAHADLHLQLRPGEDPTLLAGMLRVILAEARHDPEFCAAHVSGLDELRRAVEPFTPGYVEARADVPAASVEAAARMFAGGRRGMVSSGTGPDMAPRPNLSEHLISCLNLVCGRVGREGDAVDFPSILSADLPRPAQAIPPELLPPDLNPAANNDRLRVRGFKRIYGEMPTPGLADEIMTPGDGQVRALFVVGANPVLAIPDQDKVLKAFGQLDLLVTLDIRHTETTRLSHYAIGCAHALERADLPLYQDMFYDRPFSQYTEPVLGRSPGVMEEWQFFAGLARRLGVTVQLPGGPLEDADGISTLEVLERLLAGSKVPVRTIAEHPGGRVFDEVDVRVCAPIPGLDAKLQLAPDGVLPELADVAAEPLVREGRYGDDASYTHLLSCRRLAHVANTVGRDFPRTVELGPHNPAFLHPDDLALLGIEPGDVVHIQSEHGAIFGVAIADETVRPGVVSMTHGFGPNPGEDRDVRDTGSAVTRLVSVDAHVDPILGMARQSAVPVKLSVADD